MRRRIHWFVFANLVILMAALPTLVNAQAITRLSPNSIQAAALTHPINSLNLVVYGEGFSRNHLVYWDNSAQPTTYVSPTKLLAKIDKGAFYDPGPRQITVGNGAGISGPATFTVITDPVPILTSITPSVIQAGGGPFRLTAIGINLPRFAVIQWNLADKPTKYFSSEAVDANIEASDVAYPGTVDICLVDGGISGAVSNTISLSVVVSTPPPVIVSLEPTRVEVGSGPFGLVVKGKYFTPTSIIRWNGANRETQFLDKNSAVAMIPDTDIAAVGMVDISVMETAPGGSLSNTVKFLVSTTPSLLFPQYIAGNGFSTKFTVVNVGNTAVTGDLVIVDSLGDTFPGITQADGSSQQSGATAPVTIAPGSMRVFTLPASQSGSGISTGWAKVESSLGILKGYSSLEYRNAGVLRNYSILPNADPMPAAEIPVNNDDSVGRYTGFSATNFDSTGINLKVAVFSEDGVLLEVVSPPELNPLAPGSQAAKFLHEVSTFAKGRFRGTMILYTENQRNFIAAGLVQDEGLLSMMPVLAAPYFTIP
jgi:hypothetical protein